MKIVKVVALALLAYVALVVAFESLLGLFQPSSDGTLVIATVGEDGRRHERVLARLESDGRLFVAANHWPRAWYRRALRSPDVEAVVDGVRAPYLAVPASDEEHERLQAEHPLGLGFRLLTGFPPRYFLRLDPR